MTSKHIINCPCCFKIFKRQGCYEKHILICRRTNEETLPNTRQLYDMITTLTEKYNAVQSELDSLKRHIYTKNKKLDVLSWLNEQDRPLDQDQDKDQDQDQDQDQDTDTDTDTLANSWHTYMENIHITVDDLQVIFKNGFIEGAFEIVNNYIQSGENLELIKCFEQKNNIIYVFDSEWKEMKPDEFKSIFDGIYKKMLATFNIYKTENETKLEDEQFQLEYMDNFMKLICANMTFEQKCTRIKNKIYNELKESFKTITEMNI